MVSDHSDARWESKHGRVAKSDAHNLLERLLKRGDSAQRTMSDPASPVTWVSKIRMPKVKMNVSGRFRTERYAHVLCCISSYLNSKGELGYSPFVAIQIALAGNAADMVKHHDRAA